MTDEIFFFRDDAVDVIAEVRRVKGGLNGMKLSQILDAAESVISSKRKTQVGLFKYIATLKNL